MVSRLLLLLLVFPAFVPPAGAAGIDRRKVDALAKKWFEARPPTRFEEWDPQVRAALLAEARALGPIPEGTLREVRDLLWKQVRRYGPRARKNAIETPYGEATWLMTGKGGKDRGLVLGLHGGGEGAGSAAEATKWSVDRCLGMYPQGIRLVHDTWNTVHGERFLLTLIEIAKAQHEIDPDRVYTMGFSMGGTGSWFMAGRHPDLLAGSSPCAGVLMAEPQSQLATKEEVEAIQHGFVPNVRNLAMYYYIGLADRNCMPGTYLFVQDLLAGLREQDPGGYAKIHFETYPGLEHAFPPGEPQAGIKWLSAQKRDAFPRRIVWEYASDPFPVPTGDDRTTRLQKHWFYWLRCSHPVDRMRVIAERDGNEFDLSLERVAAAEFTILLNPQMIDVDRDVVVRVADREVYRGRPAPDLVNVLESLDARLDRTLTFDRSVKLD